VSSVSRATLKRKKPKKPKKPKNLTLFLKKPYVFTSPGSSEIDIEITSIGKPQEWTLQSTGVARKFRRFGGWINYREVVGHF